MIVTFLLTAIQNIGHPGGCKPDEALICAVADGSMAAFQELYEQASRAVYGYALSIVKNRYDAEDIMQDTFIKVREAAHLYRAQGTPMAWLLTITKNLAYMKFRADARTVCSEQPEPEDEPDLSGIGAALDRMVLKAALSQLDEQERQIIILHAVSGLKYREISDMMGLPLGSVLSKSHRSLKKLQQYLS